MSKQFKEFEIVEPTVGVMMPIMNLMDTDSNKFIMELARGCVHKNGVPIGADLDAVSFADYKAMIPLLLEVAGFGEGK